MHPPHKGPTGGKGKREMWRPLIPNAILQNYRLLLTHPGG
jgi:hypothetical protein